MTRTPQPGDVYVAPDGNDFWTGSLPAANEGGTDGPVASPLAAQRIVRRRLAAGDVRRPMTVWLREGRYELTAPLDFD